MDKEHPFLQTYTRFFPAKPPFKWTDTDIVELGELNDGTCYGDDATECGYPATRFIVYHTRTNAHVRFLCGPCYDAAIKQRYPDGIPSEPL